MLTGNTLERLVLASQSPRRLDLLRMVGCEPTVRVAAIPEIRGAGEAPAAYVTRLAREKALAVEARAGEVILAADTTVVLQLDGECLVLEKPATPEDAAAMLGRLSGRRHEVLTGFALRYGEYLEAQVVATGVEFYPLDAATIAAYVATGEPMDKAGAYAIQGRAACFVKRVEGCFYNVVGLPVGEVCRRLAEPPFAG